MSKNLYKVVLNGMSHIFHTSTTEEAIQEFEMTLGEIWNEELCKFLKDTRLDIDIAFDDSKETIKLWDRNFELLTEIPMRAFKNIEDKFKKETINVEDVSDFYTTKLEDISVELFGENEEDYTQAIEEFKIRFQFEKDLEKILEYI